MVPPPPPRSRARTALAVGALLVLTVLPRTWGLTGAGPFMWDDGIHLLEAEWLATGASAVRESAARWVEERSTGEDLWRFDAERERIASQTSGTPLFFPRPAYAVAVAIAWRASGGADWAGAAVSSVAGVLTVGVVYWIGARRWGTRTGWLAALALAVSGYHVAYSRMALAEAASVLAACIALAPLVGRTDDRRAPGAGVLLGVGSAWGVACLFQDRLLPITLVPLIVAWRVGRRATEGGTLPVAAQVAAIGAPVALLQASAEVPFYGAMLVFQHFLEPLPFPTHVERLLGHYAQGVGISGFRPENLPTYPFLYVALLGPVLAGALAWAVLRAVRRRASDALDVVVWLVVPILPASLTAAGARYAAITLPAAALLIGWIAARVVPAHRPWGLAVAVAATLPWAWAPVGWRSGHGEVARRTAGWQATCAETTQPFVSAVYLGVDGVREPPRDGRPDVEGPPCDVAIVDALGVVLRERDEATAAWLDALAAHPPDLEVANPATASILFPFEYNFSFTRTLAYLASDARRDAGTIRVYRVEPAPGS